MKILTLGDLHFGKRKNEINFFNRQLEFLEYVLFNTEYDCIIQLGDIFDNRSSVNLFIFDKVMDLFSRIEKQMYVSLGNHDQWRKESGEVNILKVLSMVNSNIHVYKDTTEVVIGGHKALFVPYLYNRNKMNEMKTVMRKNKYKFIAGHFDFNEFGGKETVTTVKSKDFKANTNLVISGHFHIQKDEVKDCVRIKHVGTPYHLDRGDRWTNSGGWIYDTEDNSWELLENNLSIKFIDIHLKELMEGKEFNNIPNNIITLLVKNSLFQQLGNNSIERNNVLNGIVDSIKQYNPLEVNIVPYNDDINIDDKNNSNDISINFSDLTNFGKMVDNFYEFRFKETRHSKAVLQRTKKMIKDLL